MARKALQTVEEVEATVEIIEAQGKALAPYLVGTKADPERLREDIIFYHKAHSQSAYEIGRRLIVLKAILPKDGTFGTYVLEHVGISRAYASQLMCFARTCVELANSSNGLLDFDRLKSMDAKKVGFLSQLVEENPEELEAKGTISGEKVDDLFTKSRKELQDLVRKQQQQVDEGKQQLRDAKEKLLAQKEKTEAILAGDPNAITMCVTRVGNTLREALNDFNNTAVLESGELPPATAHELRSLKAELRNFHAAMLDLIDERFDVQEVPTDLELEDVPDSLLKVPAPAKGKRGPKVVDV